MIFATPSEPVLDSNARFRSDRAANVAICQTITVEQQPNLEFTDLNFEHIGGEKADMKAASIKLAEEFDWSNPKTNREYIQLEQKTLARKASQDEMDRYFAMKDERDGAIFADRYLADYAEIQRLKILSEKIAEIQKFLRPIKIG
jgi:hypothetical protein